MKKVFYFTAYALLATSLFSCNQQERKKGEGTGGTVETSSNQDVNLPDPDTTKSQTKFSNVIGWASGKTPVAPAGFTVTKFADGMKSPRNIYIAPNGDILVALSNSERKGAEKIAGEISGKAKAEVAGASANTIVLLRDTNNDGKPEVRETFLKGLDQPFGMLIIGNKFYVANTDGLVVYDYKPGQTKIDGPGKTIVSLPKGGYNNHWTRNLLASTDGSKIYITVGSGSNVAEHGMENEKRRANILEVNADGSGEKIYAGGLRNPAGMAWEPVTKKLWTAVNERDNLGDELVPDYITSVQEGAFYGWPYSYYGQHEDPRRKGENPDLVKKAIVPDMAVGAHTASLGLAFYTGDKFPGKYKGGAFIGQHGSWNRSVLSGYKVAFVPFNDGKPSGPLDDFLTGFIANKDKGDVYGRPVGVTVTPQGDLLVADDVSNTIWRVSANK